MKVQVDLSQLSEASLHVLLDENVGKPLGTQVLEELLKRESTIHLRTDFDVDELKKRLQHR